MAWLRGEEPAAERVNRVMRSRAVMNWVNAGEVFYLMHRQHGPDDAERVIDHLRLNVHLDEATPERVVEAATIKAEHRMSFADAFACATSVAFEATLFTGDDEILNAAGAWHAEDLRFTS
jgi:predicted nucleic acid-binding protein